MVQKGQPPSVHPSYPSGSSSVPPPPNDPPPVSGSAPPLSVVLEVGQELGGMLMSDGTNYHAYCNASAPTLDDLPPRGAKVTICGLMSNYNLNGKVGRVTGYRGDGAVLVDVDSITGAPIHVENLMWGDIVDEDSIPVPNFMKPEMNSTLFEGSRVVRVKPPKPSKLKDASTCCPGPSGWSDVSYFRQLCWVYTNMLASMITFACFVPMTFLLLVSFGRVCILMRWLAHRHLDILLTASPPRRGIVVMHPTPTIKGGTCSAYLCSGHTWRCYAYLAMNFAFSLCSAMLCTVFFPVIVIPFVRPVYAVACNVSSACLWLERSLAVCLLTHVVGEYGAVTEMLDEPDSTPSPKIQQGLPSGERQVVRTYGSVVRDNNTVELLEDGANDDGSSRTWLANRHRSLEEKLAVEKFHSTFLKLFGRQPRLQDINIQPPREPGRGPRHFITVADSISDTERLKLIKTYKQTFSTMYVHIVDIDEQQRQEGTDYSEMYT